MKKDQTKGSVFGPTSQLGSLTFPGATFSWLRNLQTDFESEKRKNWGCYKNKQIPQSYTCFQIKIG
jgi:hypothetical protein